MAEELLVCIVLEGKLISLLWFEGHWFNKQLEIAKAHPLLFLADENNKSTENKWGTQSLEITFCIQR